MCTCNGGHQERVQHSQLEKDLDGGRTERDASETINSRIFQV